MDFELKKIAEAVNLIFTDNGHAILSPSSYEIWLKNRCTAYAYRLAESRKIAVDNIASIEGTTGHILLELAIITWTSPLNINFTTKQILTDSKKDLDYVLNNDNNSQEVKDYATECYRQIEESDYTDEMRNEIEKCYQRIKAYKDAGWEIYPERRVSLEKFFGHKYCDGTSDVVMIKGDKIIVVDLKYGRGIEVSEVKNGQALLYTAGSIAEQGKEISDFKEIEIVIMQPRFGYKHEWKTWSTTSEFLTDYIEDAKLQSYKVLNTLVSGEYEYNPSIACNFCHNAIECTARKEMVMKEISEAFAIADLNEDSLERELNKLTNDEISEILGRKPFIESYLKDIEKEAYKRANSEGKYIPGFKLVRGRKTNKWLKPQDEMIEIFDDLGLLPTDYFETKMKSVAQVRKVKLDKDIKKEIESMVNTTYGSNQLVVESDKRDSVNDIAENFRKVA